MFAGGCASVASETGAVTSGAAGMAGSLTSARESLGATESLGAVSAAVIPTSTPTSTPAVASTPAPALAPTVTSAPTPAATQGALPEFSSTNGPISAELAARMTGVSYHEHCPVQLADLHYLTVTYIGFDGQAHIGELVVASDVSQDVIEVMAQLYQARYPIRHMRLIDDFNGDDAASMAADNTSAFNCRPVTGGTAWSAHAYGTAIDINPVENPYVSGSLVLPVEGVEFVDRPQAPGVIHDGDVAVEAFAAIGWSWGGRWKKPIDWQHFSKDGN